MSGHVFFDILNNLKKGLCLSIFSRKKHDPHSLFLQVYNFVKFELNAVETTISNYQRLLAKLTKHPLFIFKLPNLKLVIDEISSSEDVGGGGS